MTNRLDIAIDNIDVDVPAVAQVGDLAGLSAAHESCAVFEYYNAHRRRGGGARGTGGRSRARAASGVEYGDARVTRGYLAVQRSELRADAGSATSTGTGSPRARQR